MLTECKNNKGREIKFLVSAIQHFTIGRIITQAKKKMKQTCPMHYLWDLSSLTMQLLSPQYLPRIWNSQPEMSSFGTRFRGHRRAHKNANTCVNGNQLGLWQTLTHLSAVVCEQLATSGTAASELTRSGSEHRWPPASLVQGPAGQT